MRACDVDIDALRDKLTGYVDNELSSMVLDSRGDAQPTAAFQRVIPAPWPMCNPRAARR